MLGSWDDGIMRGLWGGLGQGEGGNERERKIQKGAKGCGLLEDMVCVGVFGGCNLKMRPTRVAVGFPWSVLLF